MFTAASPPPLVDRTKPGYLKLMVPNGSDGRKVHRPRSRNRP